MSDSADFKVSPPKLNSVNWATWKTQIRFCFVAKKLWGYVDGSKVQPDSTADQAVQDAWEENSMKAMALLMCSIHESLIYLVSDCEDPKSAWDKLVAHFDRASIGNELYLKQRFYRMEMKEGISVDEHLKSMKELTDRLAAIGCAISEKDQAITLLGSLPKSYSTLATALESRGDDSLSLTLVQQALKQEELKMSKGASGSSSSGNGRQDALVGNGNKGNHYHGKKKKKITCYGCGKDGHKKPNCPELKRSACGNAGKIAKGDVNSSDDGFCAITGDQCHVTSEKSKAKIESNAWIIDSGATKHMCPNRSSFENFRELTVPEKVGMGDGRTVDALGVGDVYLRMLVDARKPCMVPLSNVLYVPKLAGNLFSVKSVTARGYVVEFQGGACSIRRSSGRVRAAGSLVGNLYHLHCTSVSREVASVAASESSEFELWHRRLGHLNEKSLKEMVSKDMARGLQLSKNGSLKFCDSCVEGKMHRSSFKPVGGIHSSRKLQLVHSDVKGPIGVESLGGHTYFITFIDDYSRVVKVYFMKHKAEAFEKFKEFEAMATKESGNQIGTLRTDNGGEYVSKGFENYLKLKGIRHQTTVPRTPQQNGVSERMNRTLTDTARTMLSQSGMPKMFWAEAVATAAYVRNRVLTSAIHEAKTPYERWYGRKPNVSHLRIFGCLAYVHVPDEQRHTLDKKAKLVQLVGYGVNQKGYRLYDESTRRVITRIDVKFNETEFCKPMTPVNLETELEEPEMKDEPQMQLRRSSRENKGQPAVRFDDEFAEAAHFAYNVGQIAEPKTFREALNGEHSKEWKKAADAEYASLMENGTWELVKLPDGRKPLSCRWVFRVKYLHDGKVDRFKGRVVAKGFSQKYGIDYDETFSPVVRFSSIRALLAFAVQNGMIIHQMDVVTAFLNGVLEEEIYMQQPEGYEVPGKEDHVCQLKKSIYGLKQSPRCWNKAFKEYLVSVGFRQSDADPCVFIHLGDNFAIVAAYVDDLILLTKNSDEMTELKKMLESCFKMKDMGELHYCLGVSIVQNKDSLVLHQKQYLLNLLRKYGLEDAKPVSTPSDVNVVLEKEDGVSKPVDPTMYQSMVGSLLYAAIATRPDISQAVGVVSKFNSCPTESHVTAVKRIFRYLKGSVDLGLEYKKNPSDETSLLGYSDADFGRDRDTRRSITGNVFLMSGGAISWISKRQAVVALSTAEAEYIALSSAVQEVLWLNKLLSDLGVKQSEPITLFEDNQGAIAIAQNPVGHSRTKHIDIKFHFVREAVGNDRVKLVYCPTESMVADIFTKPLTRTRFVGLVNALGLKSLHNP